MPSSVVYVVPVGSALVRWGDGVGTVPALTFALANTSTINSAVAGSIVNTSAVASGPWSIAAIPNLTITPSSGASIAAFTTVALTATATIAGTYQPELLCPGATVNGSLQTLVTSNPALPAIVLSAVSTTGVVGTPGTATGGNSGPGTVSMTATLNNGGTVTPSGAVSVAPGASQMFALNYITAATHLLTLTNNSGGTVTGGSNGNGTSSIVVSGAPAPAPAPPPPISVAYRNGQPYLFNAVAINTEPSRVAGGAGLLLDKVGPMRDYVDSAGWAWTNAGGDWLDSALVAQGTTAWASMDTPAAGAAASYSAVCTTALQRVQTLGGWNAWIVSRAGGGSVRTVAGRFHATTSFRPRIDVTYTDATTATLACRVCAFAGGGSTVPAQTADTYAMSTAAGTGEIALEFDLPTKAVSSATMHFTVTDHWGASSVLRFNLANPPRNTDPVTTGVAEAYPLDVGLSGHASIIGQHRYNDGTVLGDYTHAYIDWEASASWDPALVAGGAAADLTKLPHAGVGKWIGLGGNTTLVSSSYVGEGFAPLAAGLGALRVTMDAAVPVGNGVENPDNGTVAANAHLHLPFAKFGLLRRIFVRYYSRLASRHRSPYFTPISDNYHYLKAGLPTWTDMAGKCAIGPAHKTKEGGNSGTAGGRYGWTMRMEFGDYYYSPVSPSVGGWNLAWSFTDFQGNNPVGHRYGSGDVPPGTTLSRSFHGLAQRGGLGAVQYADRWYCHEHEIYLNSVNVASGTGDGLSWTADGEMRHWIDGRLVYDARNIVLRALPLSTGIAGFQPPVREIGHGSLWFNWYHGGLTVNSINRAVFVTALAWGESRIGPLKVAVVLPDWVPPPGEITTLTVANGRLSNFFRDAVSPNYQPFYSKTIVNDYAGAVKNQYWGTYGCTMWFGSGHASGSNDNSVILLEYGQTQATFRRLIDPTNWAASGGQNDGPNPIISTLVAFPWLESTTDGKPLSPHAWQMQTLQAPSEGGATYGTFWQAFSGAVGHAGYNAVAAYKLPLTSAANNGSTWARASAASDYPANTATWGAPLLTAMSPTQGRIYIVPNTSSPLRWLDMTTGAYGVGANAMDYVNHDGNPRGNGVLLHVAERGMIVLLYKKTGVLAAQYFYTSESNPIIRTAAVGTALTLNTSWSTAAWCPVNSRFIIAGVSADTTAFHELAIPTDPTTTWPVERAPFGAGQTFTEVEPAANANAYGKFGWDHKIRAITYMPVAQHVGADTVYVYRPRST